MARIVVFALDGALCGLPVDAVREVVRAAWPRLPPWAFNDALLQPNRSTNEVVIRRLERSAGQPAASLPPQPCYAQGLAIGGPSRLSRLNSCR